MEMTQKDYDERKARVEAGKGDDEDRRLVKLYEREGFTVKREQDREHVAETEVREDGSTVTRTFEEKQFDPSEHTVPEVNEYLASVEDNESEYNRVWDAEVAGQNRKGIVGEA